LFFFQGGKPTPFDRNLGLKLASKALDFLIQKSEIQENDDYENVAVIGMRSKQIKTTSVAELKNETDFE